MENLWESSTSSKPSYPEQIGRIETDVCVVGAGITGLTTALQLVNEGRDVVVLEAQKIGYGTTGSSSNHLTTHIDFTYRKVRQNFGAEISQIVAQSRTKAIAYIEENVNKYQINCGFKRVDGYLYAETEDKIELLQEEYEAAHKAGLPVSLTKDVRLPFIVARALRFEDQAQFNALAYLQGIADELDKRPNCKIYENSRGIQFDKNEHVIRTPNGSVRANEFVFATHIPPFLNFHQTTSAPYRSYIVTAKVKNPPAEGLYWDMQDPYHYTRIYEHGGDNWLVVGGEDHKTGHNPPETDYYKKLEAYLRQRYDVESMGRQWSAQYYEPADGLPYIGLSPNGPCYIATGFSGDGLVYGTVAGILISDLILGWEYDWIKAYNSRRFTLLSSARNFLEENIDVAKCIILDRFKSGEMDNLKPGEGAVINQGFKHYAVYKNELGEISCRSAVCPHFGGIVHWNRMEKTWDCPCHGSRFSPEGKVLTGPATADLKEMDPDKIPRKKENTEQKAQKA